MAQEERRRHRAAVKLQQAQAEFKKPVSSTVLNHTYYLTAHKEIFLPANEKSAIF